MIAIISVDDTLQLIGSVHGYAYTDASIAIAESLLDPEPGSRATG
jgi:hypothetical protein